MAEDRASADVRPREQEGPSRRRPSVGSAYTRSMGEAGPYLFIGVQIAGAMLLFILGGYFADRWLGTTPWLILLGAVLGMVAVVASVVRAVQDLDARNRRRPPRQEPD